MRRPISASSKRFEFFGSEGKQMSRIGRKPIPVPSGVKIALQGSHVDVQGPKGKLTVPVPYGISFEQKDGVLNALRATEEHRALHGLARALVANAVHGVTQGFKKELDIVGVGYRAELKGKAVAFALGKSHPIEFKIPEGIQIAVEKQTHLVVSGADKGQVGQVAADIRALRPPDPYKQKGVRISGERLKKKAGKAGAKAGGAA
jgi:large subunit ribosomal protein L6